MKRKAVNIGLLIIVIITFCIYYACTKHYYAFDIRNNVLASSEKDSYTFDETTSGNYQIPIHIENTGYKTVLSTGTGLNLSYRLLDENGNIYKNSKFAYEDALRSPVGSLSPYSDKVYTLNIQFPEDLSDFTHGYLQVDMVDEGKFWFTDKGIYFPKIEITINK